MKIPIIIKKILKPFIPETTKYKGLILPAKRLRYCGKRFQNCEFFVKSARREIKMLEKEFGFNKNNTILDIGCGVGRIAIGILSYFKEIKNYTGVDVTKRSIEWCEKHIQNKNDNFYFHHIDVHNDRYNPNGKMNADKFKFPFNNKFDVIFLYSVFSHMNTKDIKAYLVEFKRLLSENGTIFLTGFFEENVPEITENPENNKKWSGPLHCVRYNKDFFYSLLDKYGFKVDKFKHQKATDKQSILYISHKKQKL